MRSATLLPLLLTLALLPACSDEGGGAADAGPGVDTDTSWDGGPLTPCEGDPLPGEVCVPGGTYLMGCMPYDEQCEENEKPMVEVTLSPFWIDEKEATHEEIIPFLNSLHEDYIRYNNVVTTDEVEPQQIWSAAWEGSPPICLNGEGEYWYDPTCGGCDRGEEAATGGFSWLGAKLYCEWKGKRLPTEAEWEAAARGQTKWIYPCAWEFLPCWYGAYACCNLGDECFHEACEDCCIPFEIQAADCPSLNGAKHMFGNALEWVLDGLDADHSWCASGCTNPAPREGEIYALKGGGVITSAKWTRISARTEANSNGGTPTTGIRCVRSPVSFD